MKQFRFPACNRCRERNCFTSYSQNLGRFSPALYLSTTGRVHCTWSMYVWMIYWVKYLPLSNCFHRRGRYILSGHCFVWRFKIGCACAHAVMENHGMTSGYKEQPTNSTEHSIKPWDSCAYVTLVEHFTRALAPERIDTTSPTLTLIHSDSQTPFMGGMAGRQSRRFVVHGDKSSFFHFYWSCNSVNYS